MKSHSHFLLPSVFFLWSENLDKMGKATCPFCDIKVIYLTFLSNGSDKRPNFKWAKADWRQWNKSSMKISIHKNNVKWALEQTFPDIEEITELVWEGSKRAHCIFVWKGTLKSIASQTFPLTEFPLRRIFILKKCTEIWSQN